MPKFSSNTVEIKHLQTVYLVLHPEAGLLTTESYQENAVARAMELVERYGSKAFVIEAAKINRIDKDGKPTRLYKVEKERLNIKQELL